MANCEERIAEDQRKREFDLAVDALKLEVTLFWRRSVFFWGFISAAFIAYSALFRSEDTEMPFIISCFGFVCSVAWTLVNRGSKYWQEAWEQKLERVEQEVLGRPFFKEREETLKKKGVVWGAHHFSVSRLAIALSDFVVVIWIGLAYKAFPGVTMFSMLALAVSLGWAISMLCLGRGRDVFKLGHYPRARWVVMELYLSRIDQLMPRAYDQVPREQRLRAWQRWCRSDSASTRSAVLHS